MEPIIAATVNSGWQRLKPILEAAGYPDPENAEASPDDLAARLGGEEAPAALLLWTRPEAVIEQAMVRNEDPAQALAEWIASARSLLHGYRRNRRKTLLVDVEHAVAAPDAFLRACADRLALTVPAETPALGEAPSDDTASDPVLRLIATQWAAATPEADELLEELEASAQPLAAACSTPVDCAAAWQEYRTAQQERQDESRLRELQEENELLLLQLHQVQEELESYYLALQDERGKREETDQSLTSRNKKNKQLKKKLAARDQTINQLQKELSARDQAAKKRQAEIGKWEKRYQSIQARKERRDMQLQAMRQSRSWRITAPMRALRRPLSGRAPR